MCIGLPMRVLGLVGQNARVQGRGRREVVDLRLVGPCEVGDWVLVFQAAARERLDAQRAAEINAALDLLEHGLSGALDATADPGFALPSAMSAAEVAVLTGQARPAQPLSGAAAPQRATPAASTLSNAQPSSTEP